VLTQAFFLEDIQNLSVPSSKKDIGTNLDADYLVLRGKSGIRRRMDARKPRRFLGSENKFQRSLLKSGCYFNVLVTMPPMRAMVAAGGRERRMVRDVEGFRSEFEESGFGKEEVFLQSHIRFTNPSARKILRPEFP